MNYLMIIFWLIVNIIPLIDMKNPHSNREFEDKDLSTGLCKPPVVISSIDVFPNGSIIIYKDKNWWELRGLPDKVGFISNNGTIDLKNMNEVKDKESISTVLEGQLKGRTFKFVNNLIWSWSESGEQMSGSRNGEVIRHFPPEGFSAVFHNADKDDPKFIGLRSSRVFYISTKTRKLTIVGNADGSPAGGMFRENYPHDIDAAFVRVKFDGKHDLYLFKGQKYCIRGIAAPETGNQSCGEWRENAELFGCLTGITTSPTDVTEDNKQTSDVVSESKTESSPETQSQTQSDGGQEPEVTAVTPKPEAAKQVNQAVVSRNASVLFLVFLVLHQIFNF